MARFLPYNPEQAYLLPPSVKEVVGEQHLCFFLYPLLQTSRGRQTQDIGVQPHLQQQGASYPSRARSTNKGLGFVSGFLEVRA